MLSVRIKIIILVSYLLHVSKKEFFGRQEVSAEYINAGPEAACSNWKRQG